MQITRFQNLKTSTNKRLDFYKGYTHNAKYIDPKYDRVFGNLEQSDEVSEGESDSSYQQKYIKTRPLSFMSRNIREHHSPYIEGLNRSQHYPSCNRYQGRRERDLSFEQTRKVKFAGNGGNHIRQNYRL